MTNLVTTKSRYYILVADEKTWKVALEKHQWGFSQKNVGLWNTTNNGDLVAFYVTKPIQKIIGFGIIQEKHISDELIWPDEKLFKKLLWGHRLKFNSIYVIENWNYGISVPTEIMLNVGRKVVPKNIFLLLIKNAEKKWKRKIIKQF